MKKKHFGIILAGMFNKLQWGYKALSYLYSYTVKRQQHSINALSKI